VHEHVTELTRRLCRQLREEGVVIEECVVVKACLACRDLKRRIAQQCSVLRKQRRQQLRQPAL
jgi:hypothetical protein